MSDSKKTALISVAFRNTLYLNNNQAWRATIDTIPHKMESDYKDINASGGYVDITVYETERSRDIAVLLLNDFSLSKAKGIAAVQADRLSEEDEKFLKNGEVVFSNLSCGEQLKKEVLDARAKALELENELDEVEELQ